MRPEHAYKKRAIAIAPNDWIIDCGFIFQVQKTVIDNNLIHIYFGNKGECGRLTFCEVYDLRVWIPVIYVN